MHEMVRSLEKVIKKETKPKLIIRVYQNFFPIALKKLATR